MRGLCVVLVAAGLAACAPTVPDSGAGVGFDDYDTYLAQRQSRDAQLRRQGSGAPATAATPEQQTARDAVAAVRGSSGQPERGESVPAGIQNTSPNAPVPDLNNPSISDEQDFQAVSSRQSIESDAERRKAQSAQYQVIAPTALPRRPGGNAPTPVEFALETSHPVGQKVYRRSVFSSSKTAKACAGYSSAELAQDAFLKAGGPQKDKIGVDPDGDGYACGWNPAKYRGLVRG
ncbi:hypothetical protein [Litoreibacter janthinus]|uniref:Excalibur calcium-binding domain-containing protein n=1 Tax=Litoreibacter janthinus TaxID=670154 RepID=A0A1I6GLE9_9RHOB|nr:hypothetical protein [Litoreibacter janthinus]SFR43045.1 hypothetical protein SAMN04488002_1668 [Litoreibacter janthinus]